MDKNYYKKKTEQLQQENQSLKDRINKYEDPEDLTLMFMYCNEKAKDKIKELKEKYNQALSIMAEYSPPCEKDGFMDKNTDYCRMNCGVDEEVFKECWNRYIEQQLKGDKECQVRNVKNN